MVIYFFYIKKSNGGKFLTKNFRPESIKNLAGTENEMKNRDKEEGSHPYPVDMSNRKDQSINFRFLFRKMAIFMLITLITLTLEFLE